MHNRWMLLIFNFVLLISLVIPGLTFANADLALASSWQPVGQVGGPAKGLAVQGNYAYMGVGPSLVVVDITNSNSPTQVGKAAPFAYYIQGVVVQGNLAYVSAGSAGLRVVNISNPTAPVEISAWQSPGFAEKAAVVGSKVYLADGPYGLRIIDVSNPTQPIEVGRAFEMNYAYDITVSGRYAYIAAGGAGLLVVDISNPQFPLEIGRLDTTGYSYGLAVVQNQVYVADGWGGLLIVNAVNPQIPVITGRLQTDGRVVDVAVSGSLAFLADSFKGIRVIDVSNSAGPIEKSRLVWQLGTSVGIEISGGQVYVTDENNGLRIINLANADLPAQAGYFSTFFSARQVVTKGNYAFVAGAFNGLRIIDISTPSRPIEVANYETSAYTQCIDLEGDRLYVGTMPDGIQEGIHVLDISNPTQPVKLGWYPQHLECWGLDVVGTTGYIADVGNLQVVDFSNPAAPVLLGQTYEYSRSVSVSGSYAYIAQQEDGVKIFNISDPAHITVAGTYKVASSFTRDVKAAGSRAYVSDNTIVRILDISNPADPKELSTFTTPGDTEWITVDNNKLYVANGSYGFQVLDISNPLAPVEISRYNTLGFVQGLAVNGENLIVADIAGGLFVMEPSTAALTKSSSEPIARMDFPVLPSDFPKQRLSSKFISSQNEKVNRNDSLRNTPAARLSTTCVVNSAADSGAGTLRACLENSLPGDVIHFNPAIFLPSAPVTIYLTTRLPWLVGSITLDASNAGVILDGTSVTGPWDGGISMSTNDNIVRGLQIRNFPGAGIGLMGQRNVIGGSRMVGNGPVGQGNAIYANGSWGIWLDHQPNENVIIDGNIIKGNIIGLDASGTQARGNFGGGIFIKGAQNNIVGSLVSGEGNIISSNHNIGIQLYGNTTTGNLIVGNFIGTDITGSVKMGNWHSGIVDWLGASNTLVQGNLVSGNQQSGITIWDPGSDYITLIGNKIGTDASGTLAIPNQVCGIFVGHSSHNRIGGSEPGEGNLVNGIECGIFISGERPGNHVIIGNRIGTNASGDAALGTLHDGVILSQATQTILGAATPAERNLISGSIIFGVNVTSDDNVVLGNAIGTSANSSSPLGSIGMAMSVSGNRNLFQANTVANGVTGVWLNSPQTNTLRRNSIFANSYKGINLENGANNNLSAPTIALDSGGGSGSTCANCTVELFLDSGNQGRIYLDSITANGGGAFQFNKYCPLTYANLTATVTDTLGSTSPFSESQAPAWDCLSSNPLPVLISLVPPSAKEHGATFMITITGTGFIPGSTVRLNNFNLTTHYLASNTLEAIVPLGQINITGDVSITVLNPNPGGGSSNPLIFTILPLPKVYLPMIRK